ncbi:MAG: xanthine dehydrogenase FAD-binding subunit XdhB [Lachnospiraceae bacterium]|nr:xanthine dehydrogenase FAD-binding subunit XdhB [Lachnospiraceae bacterium]
MYDIKKLYEAESVQDAIRLLTEHPEAHIIAGGSDVLIKIRAGKLAGCELVSIYGLDELRGVTMEEDGTIRIGSLTSFNHIYRDPLIQKYIPVLGEAVNMVGGPQIRAIGTIGGNTCNGVTSADSASTLCAYDAIVEIEGPDGVRTVSINEFYAGPGRVHMAHNEVQRALLIPKKSYTGYKGKYIKYGMRNAMEIATTGCSVNVKLSRDKKEIRDIRIGFGVAAPNPIRAREAEKILCGLPVSEETVKKCGEVVLLDVNPRSSWRAEREFRLHLCSTLAMRALTEAVNRSGGKIDG